mmetsp:Transcript_16326/g.25099  ORF Transcript_16326/g.25099 Transcript_16326/m.25099 type:complete len:218 (-) Transcript_16326:790-1443(-)
MITASVVQRVAFDHWTVRQHFEEIAMNADHRALSTKRYALIAAQHRHTMTQRETLSFGRRPRRVRGTHIQVRHWHTFQVVRFRRRRYLFLVVLVRLLLHALNEFFRQKLRRKLNQRQLRRFLLLQPVVNALQKFFAFRASFGTNQHLVVVGRQLIRVDIVADKHFLLFLRLCRRRRRWIVIKTHHNLFFRNHFGTQTHQHRRRGMVRQLQLQLAVYR